MEIKAAMAEDDSKINLYNGLLIALLTVVAALVAWRASVADDAAGDEDYAGLQATVNAEETRAVNYVEAMEHYGAFLNFHRNSVLSDTLGEKEGREAADLAAVNLGQFPARFMNRDGTYSVQRDLGSMWQDAAKIKDMDDAKHFEDSEKFRDKSLKLSLAVVVLTLALVVLTLVETLPEGGAQIACLVFGALIGGAGTVWSVLLELGK